MTVVVPTLGTSPFAGEAVASALGECPAEVIVVADGGAPTDELSHAGARVIRLPRREGRSAARNAGVDTARTRFVAFLDDDDLALPGGLGRLRAALATAPAAVLAFGPVRVVDAAGQPLAGWNERLARRFRAVGGRQLDAAALLATHAPVYTSATMARTDAFRAAGGYDRRFDAYEDLDLYLRLARRGAAVACGGAPVAAYRLHGANTSSDELYAGLLALTEKHLPGAHDSLRRELLERRVESLWGLGRFRGARREALRAAREQPRLLREPRFVRRLVATLLPVRLLDARR